jgi:hypothetical protein
MWVKIKNVTILFQFRFHFRFFLLKFDAKSEQLTVSIKSFIINNLKFSFYGKNAFISYAFRFCSECVGTKVNSTGMVGIGTANPQYKLDVTGDTRVAGDIYLGSDSNFIATTNNVPITFSWMP